MDGSANEQDLSNELKKLLGDNNNQVDALFNQANLERAQQEQKLKDKLSKRHQKVEQELQQETDKIIA